MKVPFEKLIPSSRWLPAPGFLWLFSSFFVLTILLFLRPPTTNFVFDEQEALLANPYLTGDLPFRKLLEVDFWGRSPERTIGSYRPLPNLLWRGLAFSLDWQTPWLLAWLNLAAHAANAALLGRLAARLCPRSKELPWILGGLFVSCATSVEAVCGVVGLADLLVLFFTLLACHALLTLKNRALLFASLTTLVFAGCLSKETQLTLLPGLVLATPVILLLRPGTRVRGRELFQQTSLVVVAGLLAQWGALELRKFFYPIPSPQLSESGGAEPGSGWQQFRLAIERYWNSPPWPHDVFNNPLLEATQSERLATGSAMYLDQLRQLVLPWDLTGDYSFPHQPVHSWDALAWGGAFLFLSSNCVALGGLAACLRRRRIGLAGLFALGWLWFSLSYLPLSGAFISLPTIRAERLVYPGLAGFALVLAALYQVGRLRWLRPPGRRIWGFCWLAFVLAQCFFARRHASHFADDVSFWRAACAEHNPSAKSYLNLGVMLGARGDLDARLKFTQRAASLAPKWPMAQIYLADTYCRRGEMPQAREPYLRGLALAPQSKAMTALSLQCIWDKGYFPRWRADLSRLAQENTGSWLDYFVYELAERGEENEGIPKKYRPRRYNRRRAGED